mgnify:CR=1 FL=1
MPKPVTDREKSTPIITLHRLAVLVQVGNVLERARQSVVFLVSQGCPRRRFDLTKTQCEGQLLIRRLSLINISEHTRLGRISYAVF